MKNLFTLFLLACALFIFGCGGDDDGPVGPAFCTDQAFSEAVNQAVTELSTATQAYINDQSAANCTAYKAAAQNYLDEVSRFENCSTIGTRQDFRDALQAARESVDMSQC